MWKCISEKCSYNSSRIYPCEINCELEKLHTIYPCWNPCNALWFNTHAVMPDPLKREIKYPFECSLKDYGLFVEGYLIAQLPIRGDKELHIGLGGLRLAGFRGRIRISEDFTGEPLYEVTI